MSSDDFTKFMFVLMTSLMFTLCMLAFGQCSGRCM